MNGSMSPLGGSGRLMKRSFSVNTSPVGHAFTIDLVRCPLFFAPPPPIKSIASTHQILLRWRGLVTARLRLVQLPLLTLLLPLAQLLSVRQRQHPCWRSLACACRARECWRRRRPRCAHAHDRVACICAGPARPGQFRATGRMQNPRNYLVLLNPKTLTLYFN